MNELEMVRNTSDQTPIEILLQIGEDGRASARNVYRFLEMAPGSWARWYKTNILDNQFSVEGEDWIGGQHDAEDVFGGAKATVDFRLSIPFAKKLCMLARSERGEQARNYFVEVEETLKSVARNLPKLSANEVILQIAQANVKLEREICVVREEVRQISGKFDVAIKTFTAPSVDRWQADMNAKIDELTAMTGSSPLKLRGQLYAELEQTANVLLAIRRNRLKTRMRKQGATHKEREAVTKLDVISKDKQLRAIFEGIVKARLASACAGATGEI